MSPVKRAKNSSTQTPEERLGIALRRAREDADMEQIEVALELQVHYMTVSRWETGKNAPTATDLERLATLYKVPVDRFIGIVSHETEGALAAPLIFGATVQRLREALDMSVGELGAKVGMSAPALTQLEAGTSSRAQREKLLPKFEKALTASRAELLSLTPPRRGPEPRVADSHYAAEQVWQISRELRQLADRTDEIHRDLLTRVPPRKDDAHA